MPILPEETDHYPQHVFDQIRDGREWVVAETRPRQEKAVARELHAQQIPFYLPCNRRRIQIRGRIVTSQTPVFSGYVFARTSKIYRIPLRFHPRICRVIAVHDQKQLWKDLHNVRQLLDLGEPVVAESKLEPGTPVRIRDGPLTGMTGTIVKAAGGFKIEVQVDFLRQGLSVLLNGSTLGVVISHAAPSSS